VMLVAVKMLQEPRAAVGRLNICKRLILLLLVSRAFCQILLFKYCKSLMLLYWLVKNFLGRYSNTAKDACCCWLLKH
jgi:hypothetical protein